MPDRGEHEHLVHHLDVEELRHDELLRFDEQLRLAVTSLRAPLVLQGGTFFPNVALSSVQSPQTPAYASTQYSKKFSSGIYISWKDSAHNHYQNMTIYIYVQRNSPERFVHEGIGKC